MQLVRLTAWISGAARAKIPPVADDSQDAMRQWAERAVEGRWPGARLAALCALKGDASMRRFWRGSIHADQSSAPATVIAIDLGPDDLPLYARVLNLVPQPLAEPPFLNVHRLMEQIGVAVPALHAADVAERKLLVEDLGDLSLYAAVKENPARTAELYRLAIDELLKLHGRGTAAPNRDCLAYSVAYDERLLRWEMQQFVEYGVPAIAPGADPSALPAELDRLAANLGALPRVLSHRDYHYQNLFIQEHGGAVRIRVIDFQDALMAPAAQDLAVLLTTRDTGALISPALESDLLDYYFGAAAGRGALGLDRSAFVQSYRWCVLQHALKVIGRFVFLEQTGKAGYTQYLPATIAQARRMLEADSSFPALRAVMRPV
jgi:aminoglycoside/choline kinase family phosphotransferase